ncbi:hypothetical protein F5X96DRAFT_673378 [Biscogniauxia mediterranea]|nr:hypothetical protein F5X96DRAFT_673378 [Biscogniauxia mediterranea]
MKIPIATNVLFSLLFIFCATTTAEDAQPGSETEWSCTHLEMLEDGHTVKYMCSVIGSRTPAIALTSRSNGGNSSHSNSTNESGSQHDPILGTVDLNACVGTTAGHAITDGGRLMFENNGCLVNLCRNCSFVAAKAGGGHTEKDRYVHEGPFGSRNASLSCAQCDSAEGLGMTKDNPSKLAVGQFLSFAEKGRRGLRCKIYANDKRDDDGLGAMRRADLLADGEALPHTADNNDPAAAAPANYDQAHVGQHEHNPHRQRDSNPPPPPPMSMSDICASRRDNAPWARFQLSLADAGCEAPRLQDHLLRAKCPWTATGDPGDTRNVTSALDLNGCLRNAGGRLEPAPDGGYAGSCRDCRVDVGDGVALVCMCAKGGGYEGGAQAQLDGTEALQVLAGTLMCQGKLGVVEIPMEY